jgi:hypothetical protein
MAAIALIAALCASVHAQPNSRCTTIAIEYIGKTDRPVFPIIISASPEEAEWYKQKLYSDPVSTFAHVYIVGESTLEEIVAIPLPNGDMKPENPGVGPRTSPALRLVLAKGHNSEEVDVEASESALLLGEIKKRVSKYPQLVERLADIEGRMNRYLQQSH